MIDNIVQFIIAVLGALAIFLLASKSGRTRRWGYVAGLASEPFWFYASLTTSQWGVLALAFWWSYFYTVGAINNWRVE